MNYKIDQQTEDQIIDALVAQGYDEDAVLDAIVDIEDSESFEGTYFASGDRAAKKEARQQKKAAKEAKKAEKQAAKDAKKAAKEEKKERRQEAKTRKQELKNEAKEARINRKNIKAEATANKRNAKAEGIANGTYDPMGGLGSALGGVASKFLNAGDEGGEVVEEKSNLPLILGIGGGVLAIVIIVVIILVTRKK